MTAISASSRTKPAKWTRFSFSGETRLPPSHDFDQNERQNVRHLSREIGNKLMTASEMLSVAARVRIYRQPCTHPAISAVATSPDNWLNPTGPTATGPSNCGFLDPDNAPKIEFRANVMISNVSFDALGYCPSLSVHFPAKPRVDSEV